MRHDAPSFPCGAKLWAAGHMLNVRTLGATRSLAASQFTDEAVFFIPRSRTVSKCLSYRRARQSLAPPPSSDNVQHRGEVLAFRAEAQAHGRFMNDLCALRPCMETEDCPGFRVSDHHLNDATRAAYGRRARDKRHRNDTAVARITLTCGSLKMARGTTA
jgi:hypothetical protein